MAFIPKPVKSGCVREEDMSMKRTNANRWKCAGALFATLAFGSGVALAFDYDKTPGGANLIHADDAPGESRIALTRNACTIDTSMEVQTYVLGIDEWRNVDRTPPLFEDRFFSNDCSTSIIDSSNEVALVRNTVIDGALGRVRRRCAVRDGIWRIVETDVLVATDVGSAGSLFFQQGTVLNPGDPRELSPDNNRGRCFRNLLA